MSGLQDGEENQFYIFFVQDKSAPHHIERWTRFLSDESVVDHFKNTDEIYLLDMYQKQMEQPDTQQMIHTSVGKIPFMTKVTPIHREKGAFDIIYIQKKEMVYCYVKGIIEVEGKQIDTEVWLFEGEYEVEFYHKGKPYIVNQPLHMEKLIQELNGRM